MDENEIRKIAAMYFGFTPKLNEKKLKMRIVEPEDGEKIKIKWEEHIGNMSGVARVSPLDIMHDLKMENTEENYRKAVDIMKAMAGEKGIYLVEVEGKYLLINSKFRR